MAAGFWLTKIEDSLIVFDKKFAARPKDRLSSSKSTAFRTVATNIGIWMLFKILSLLGDFFATIAIWFYSAAERSVLGKTAAGYGPMHLHVRRSKDHYGDREII